jgi:cell division protein FtsB
MSSLASQARVRVPRFTGAIEKARLTLVPARRVQAPRAPFAVLVFAILGMGVVGLLMFNTHMQQASFYATKLQAQADDLTARQQKLDMELADLRDPQRLATAAKDLGMVAPGVPLFVDLANGKVDGTPTVATPQDAVAINPPPASLPEPLKPTPLVITIKPPANSQVRNGPASTPANARTGTNKTQPVD